MKAHDPALIHDHDQYPHLFHILKKKQVQGRSRDPTEFILGRGSNSSTESRYIHFLEATFLVVIVMMA